MRRQLLLLLSEQLHRKRRAESRDRLGWPESAASQQGQQSRLSDEEETYRSYRVAFVRRGPPRSVALFLLLLHSVSSALYGSLFLRPEFERVSSAAAAAPNARLPSAAPLFGAYKVEGGSFSVRRGRERERNAGAPFRSSSATVWPPARPPRLPPLLSRRQK